MPRFNAVFLAAAVALMVPAPAQPQALDFDVYRNTVEPIFLARRAGHARCVICHAPSNNAFTLLPLRGKAAYTEEQSRKNFEIVSHLVVPGKPEESHLLMYPLVPQEGGSAYHSGGRQWEGKNDPNWQAIARWVNGQK
jgi:hypothetical protein